MKVTSLTKYITRYNRIGYLHFYVQIYETLLLMTFVIKLTIFNESVSTALTSLHVTNLNRKLKVINDHYASNNQYFIDFSFNLSVCITFPLLLILYENRSRNMQTM